MNLVIDVGNTLTKAALFKGHELKALWKGEVLDRDSLLGFIEGHQVGAAIISSVRQDDKGVDAGYRFLNEMDFTVLKAGLHLEHPLKIRYKTPETLGSDRLAAALGGYALYPGENVLVINAGTCLTSDFVNSSGEYLGGTISPGLSMRLRALHDYTGKLPVVNAPDLSSPEGNNTNIPMPGQSTHESILSGVTHGMVYEIDGLIESWMQKIRFFNVILSGGDGIFFDKKLKNRIFALDNIVLYGLNVMIQYNV